MEKEWEGSDEESAELVPGTDRVALVRSVGGLATFLLNCSLLNMQSSMNIIAWKILSYIYGHVK
jgi:hypothetical protein